MNQKGFTAVFVVLCIVFIALLAYGSYYIWGTQTSEPNLIAQTVPLPSSIADPTSNWKTFNGKSFTFKYPAELKIPPEAIDTKSEGFIVPTDVKGEYLEVTTGKTEVMETGLIQTVEEKKEWATKNVGYWHSNYQGKSKIGGFDALIFATNEPRLDIPTTSSIPPGSIPPYKLYIIFTDSELNGKKAIREVKIAYFAHTKNALIFEQILSTFQFTN